MDKKTYDLLHVIYNKSQQSLKKIARKRSNPITVWLDEKELMLLKDKISKTNFYRSDYIRKCSPGKTLQLCQV